MENAALHSKYQGFKNSCDEGEEEEEDVEDSAEEISINHRE